MGGTLGPEHTPGGGLTMVLSLPAARVDHAARTVPADGDEQPGDVGDSRHGDPGYGGPGYGDPGDRRGRDPR
jgi:hypothetical protein